MKRAITLGGGGPAAGIHIGVLEGLKNNKIEFDVWALSCIGAWVGIVYNQFDDDQVERTYNFFRDGVFRDDESYSGFPVNMAFGPDVGAHSWAVIKFLSNPLNYANPLPPASKFADAFRESISFWSDPKNWSKEGDLNSWILNQVMAVHPFSRFLTSLMYLSPVSGLSRIYYSDSSFLNKINVGNLFNLQEKTFIYHNAWNMDLKELHLFSNQKADGYKDITRESLCACSALPFIEETVAIKNAVGKSETYCEGALVETVNFSRLIQDHPDLEEIWVSRIVDIKQVRPPKNISDALGILCMLFAGSLGDDDVELFRYHARDAGWQGTIYEIPVAENINFDWNHSNLESGRKAGLGAVSEPLNFRAFLLRYLDNEFREAEISASRFKRTDYPLGFVAKAVAAHRLNKTEQAQDAIKLLIAKEGWHNQKQVAFSLGRTIYNNATHQRVMQDLVAAGLP
jgi:hypothetical protein